MLSGNNASENNGNGISLRGSNNTLTNNVMNYNIYNFNLEIGDNPIDNKIEKTNLVNGKPIYYLKNAVNTVYNSSANAGTFYCISCINVTIKDMNLNNNGAGIYFWNTTYSRIQNVNASNNEIDISLFYSSNNLASNNVGNIYLWASSNNTLNGNYGGISLSYLSNNNMLSNNNASNNGLGINLWASNNNTMSNNNLGIYLWASSNNTMSNNNASNNEGGISLWDSSNYNSLIGNIASNNNGNGISLKGSSNYNTLIGNIASNNNGNGINLELISYDNVLSGNIASNNKGSGISLVDSSNNLIYNNYFNNTNNAYDDGNNIWNLTKTIGTNIIGGSWLGGNYWSDYAGNDADSDGLGDTLLPYNSSGSITNGGDFLPLTITPTPTSGSISGFKINDTNANGKWDASEKGISNWTIRLIGITGKRNDSKVIRKETFTDATGFYTFDNLPAGRYFVIEKLRKGFVPTGSPVKRIKLAQYKNSFNNNFTNRPANSMDKIDGQSDVDDYEAIDRSIDRNIEDTDWDR